MPVILRPYEPRDREALCAIWFDSYESAGLRHEPGGSVAGLQERWNDEIATRWVCWIAEEADRLIGFVAYAPQNDHLHQLFVDRTAQGRGVGLRLLNHVKTVLPGGFRLRTDVDNHGARRFYEREGMALEGIGPSPRFGTPVCTYRWP